MSKKPQPEVRRGRAGILAPNERSAASIALGKHGNPEMISAATALWLADLEAGEPHAGRYSRVRDALTREAQCSHDAAEDAIRGMRSYNAERYMAEMPFKVAEISQQLQRIADASELEEPAAAVSALREIGKLNGLYAARKIEIVPPGDSAPDVQAQLRAMVDVLSPAGRIALDVVLSELDAAKSAGRLSLPSPAIDVDTGEN